MFQKMKNPFIIASNLTGFKKNVSVRYSRAKSLLRTLISCREKSSEDCTKNSESDMTKATSDTVELISIKTSKNSKVKLLYLLDRSMAKKFASIVVSNRATTTSHVIELNPGYGFLTKELLDAGVPFVHLFEATVDFAPHLTDLSEKYPNRILLGDTSFQSMLHMGYVDWRESTKKVDSYFQKIREQTSNNEPHIQIIGSMGNEYLINQIVYGVVFKNLLFKYGRPVTYAAVPPSVTATLRCTNEHYALYRPRVIIFQTLFRCQVIGHLPRSVFYPKYKSTKAHEKCVRDIRAKDHQSMHVVKIEPRLDIFDDKFTETDIMPFYFFVNHHLRSRKNRIIPSLENSIPGCGRMLISQGINIFTEFGELLPDEILSLFKNFKSFPGYKKSTFMSCFNAFLAKIDEHIIFNDNREHIDDLFESSINAHENAAENLED